MNRAQSNRQDQRPILVTGAHRSGTTWVGKMLAADEQVGYISEPLNVWHRPGVMRSPVKHWYTYINEDNGSEYSSALVETIHFQYHTRREIQSLRSIKDILRMGRDWRIFYQGRAKQQRALLKDPFAVFSSVWFSHQLDCKVVIIVRHPAAFVSSLKRLDWALNFSDLLEQPLLMDDLLFPYREEIVKMVTSPGDVIEKGCLLWRMIYSVVRTFREQYPGFLVVRHEDFATNPIDEYRRLYRSVGLIFTPHVEKTIVNSSSARNPVEASRKARHSYRLNSRANLANWKRRLGLDEIERVRDLTADVAPFYYTADEWV